MKSFECLAFVKDTGFSVVDTTWGPVRIGVYARHLSKWLKHFPLERMLFVSGERLIADPALEMARVQVFPESRCQRTLHLIHLTEISYIFIHPTEISFHF